MRLACDERTINLLASDHDDRIHLDPRRPHFRHADRKGEKEDTAKKAKGGRSEARAICRRRIVPLPRLWTEEEEEAPDYYYELQTGREEEDER